MNIEVGMFVRIKDLDFVFENNRIQKLNNKYAVEWFKKNIDIISKSSHELIDLIEIGDYVNGLLVVEYDNKNHCFICECGGMFTGENWIYKSGDIKSIVTKEQFENVKYKIGE